VKFLFVSSLGATVLARSRLEEKKMKAMAQKRSTPPLLALAVFAEENSWSRSLKKAQKNECVVVSSFV